MSKCEKPLREEGIRIHMVHASSKDFALLLGGEVVGVLDCGEWWGVFAKGVEG